MFAPYSANTVGVFDPGSLNFSAVDISTAGGVIQGNYYGAAAVSDALNAYDPS
jgi:hypothetical protein